MTQKKQTKPQVASYQPNVNVNQHAMDMIPLKIESLSLEGISPSLMCM